MSNEIWIKIKHKQYPKDPEGRENDECGAEFTIREDKLHERLSSAGIIRCPNCGKDIQDSLWGCSNFLKHRETQQQYFDFSFISPSDKRAQQLVESLLKAIAT